MFAFYIEKREDNLMENVRSLLIFATDAHLNFIKARSYVNEKFNLTPHCFHTVF